MSEAATPSSSILAIVEADGIFEGRRRVRLSVTCDLKSFQDALLRKVVVDLADGDRQPPTNDEVEIQIFDSKTQQFQPMTDVPSSSSSCRLRIVLDRNNRKHPSSSELQHDQPLALPWKEFDVDLSDGSFLVNNKPLRIQEVANAGLGTGLNVWDGSIALTRYLEKNAKEFVQDKTVLEVGAGTGLVGIATATMGTKRVILTDLEYSIANLKENIRINQEQDGQPMGTADTESSTAINTLLAEAMVLDWFRPEDFELWKGKDKASAEGVTIDTILASDVVWIDSLVLPLVQTLQFICSRAVANGQAPPSIIMSYQRRSGVVEELLMRTLRDHSFELNSVPKEEVKSERIQIFRIAYQV